MSDIFFTSDEHYGHKKILILGEGRPFTSLEEMHETMIERHNAVVRPGDRVYHLGDIFFKATEEEAWAVIKRLNGQHYLVRGNHDELADAMQSRAWNQQRPPFVWIKDFFKLKVGNERLVLFHRPLRSWDNMETGAWHLFGHVHGRLSRFGNSFDVGVDAYNFEPVSFERVAQRMANGREVCK